MQAPDCDGAAEQQPDTAGVLQQGGLDAEHSTTPCDDRQPDTQLPPADPASPQKPHSPKLGLDPAVQQGPSPPMPPEQQQQEQQQQVPSPGLIEVIADVHGTGPDAFAAPSDFMMYVFKVLPCPHGNSHAWAQCPFLHPGEHARRRDPRVYPYSPVACPDMKRFNACPKGDACSSSHGDFEYWLHPHRYRTQLCRDGAACHRRVCFFAHDPRDLRPPTTVLGPDSQLPLVPAAMPRVIGPAAVSGMGAPGSGVVVVVGRPGNTTSRLPGGSQGSPVKSTGAAPAVPDLPESAGLFTVNVAPPAAATAALDGAASTGSGASTPQHATGAAAGVVGQQLAALRLGASSSSSSLSGPSNKKQEGSVAPTDASADVAVQDSDPGSSSEAGGAGVAAAAVTDGMAGSPTRAAAAAAAPGLDAVGTPTAPTAAAQGSYQQQSRLAVEVLDASGKPVFIHPDNLKLLDVLLVEVPPEDARRNLPRASGAPVLRFQPPDMPEAMAAGNRGHNPSSRYPGPAGTIPLDGLRPGGGRRGGNHQGVPFPPGGYGRGGPGRGGGGGFAGGPQGPRRYGGMQQQQQQGGMGGLPLAPGLGHAGGGGPPYHAQQQAGRMLGQQQQQQQQQHQVLLPHGGAPMYQQQAPPGIQGPMLQPHRQQQQQQQPQLGAYGGAMDGYGAAAQGVGWGMPGGPGAGWPGGAAATAAGMQPSGATHVQQPLQGGVQGVVATGRQYPGQYPGQPQQQPQQQQQQQYVVVQDGQSGGQSYWLQPNQQQQHVMYAQQLQAQQQQQPYYVMQSGDGMQLQAGAGGTASAAMLVMRGDTPAASLPYAAASSSSAMGLGLMLGPGAGGVPQQGVGQQQQQQQPQQQQHVDGQALYGAAHTQLLQGMHYVMLPGSQPSGLEHTTQQQPQQLPW